jgi:hypothetical protein
MSQNTARHDQHARSEDEDAVFPQARPTEGGAGAHLRQPVGEPAGDEGVSPDEPDVGEFGLIGDNDLGAADLGPAAPGAHDPDAGSGRMRKIAPDSVRDTRRG